LFARDMSEMWNSEVWGLEESQKHTNEFMHEHLIKNLGSRTRRTMVVGDDDGGSWREPSLHRICGRCRSH